MDAAVSAERMERSDGGALFLPRTGICTRKGDGRSWDRTTTKPNPPAATETDYSGDLQEGRGSPEDDDVPLEPTPFHRALGQPVDKEDEDDAPSVLPRRGAQDVCCETCRRPLPLLGGFYRATCKRRDCPSYSSLWGRDQFTRLLVNLYWYRGRISMTTLTAPGYAVIPEGDPRAGNGSDCADTSTHAPCIQRSSVWRNRSLAHVRLRPRSSVTVLVGPGTDRGPAWAVAAALRPVLRGGSLEPGPGRWGRLAGARGRPETPSRKATGEAESAEPLAARASLGRSCRGARWPDRSGHSQHLD